MITWFDICYAGKDRGTAARRTQRKAFAPAARESLSSQSQAMPLAANGLQLVHSTVVRMEEIRSIGKYLGMGRPNGALRPTRRLEAPAVLRRLGCYVDTELHLVFHTCCLCRNQTSPAFNFFAHSWFDARSKCRLHECSGTSYPKQGESSRADSRRGTPV